MSSESTHSWVQPFQYVDVKNKNGEWYAGYVLTVKNNEAMVRLDGYASKHDEVLPLNSPKIKPFRSVTKGYTGHRDKIALRDHWAFSNENHVTRLKTLTEVTDAIFQKTTHEITQYVRGENYFYIDFVFTRKYHDRKSVELMIKYISQHVKLTELYFETFTHRKLPFFPDEEKSSVRAFFDCHYQILDVFRNFTGNNLRNAAFHRENEPLLSQLSPEGEKFSDFFQRLIVTKTELIPKFDAMVSRLQNSNQISDIPISFYRSLAAFEEAFKRLVPDISSQLRQEYQLCTKKSISQKLYNVLSSRLNSLSPEDVRNFDKEIDEIQSHLKMSLYCSMTAKEKNNSLVSSRLFYYKCLIQSEVLEKKLKGLIELKRFVDEVIEDYHDSETSYEELQDIKHLQKQVSKLDFFSAIFEHNEHTEVIKKGFEAALSLYSLNVVGFGWFEKIWEVCFLKHEAVQLMVFQFWTDLVRKVRKEDEKRLMDTLLTKTEILNQNDRLQYLLQFLHSVHPDDLDSSQIDRLIDVIHQSTLKAPKYLEQFAKQICEFDVNTGIVQTALEICLNSINKGASEDLHLKLLGLICCNCRKISLVLLSSSSFGILVEFLERKFQKHRKDSQKLRDNEVELEEAVAMSRSSKRSPEVLSEEYLRSFMRIINDFISIRSVKFDEKHFFSVWNLFIRYSQECRRDFMEVFYSWVIVKSYHSNFDSHTYGINKKLKDIKLTMSIFEAILEKDRGMFDYSTVSFDAFQMFKEFFISGNAQKLTLEPMVYYLPPKKVVKVKKIDVYGMEQLWDLFYQSEMDEPTTKELCKFICDIYLKIDKVEIKTVDHINRLLQMLNQLENSLSKSTQDGNISLVNKILQLLYFVICEVLEKVEGLHSNCQPRESSFVTIRVEQVLEHLSENGDRRIRCENIKISKDDPFIQVKEKISSVFNLPVYEFRVAPCGGSDASRSSAYRNSQDTHQHHYFNTIVNREKYELSYELNKFERNCFRIEMINNPTAKNVLNFFENSLKTSLIHFLKVEETSQKVINILDCLNYSTSANSRSSRSSSSQEIYQVLISYIENEGSPKKEEPSQGQVPLKRSRSSGQSPKAKICIYRYFLKIFLEKSKHQINEGSLSVLKILIRHFSICIELKPSISYLIELSDMFITLAKKNKETFQLVLCQNEELVKDNILSLILQLLKKIGTVSSNHEKLVKVATQANILECKLINKSLILFIELFADCRGALLYMLKDFERFKALIYELCFSPQLPINVKRIFERKLCDLISKRPLSIDQEEQLLLFFLNEIYPKLMSGIGVSGKYSSDILFIFKLLREQLMTLSEQCMQRIFIQKAIGVQSEPILNSLRQSKKQSAYFEQDTTAQSLAFIVKYQPCSQSQQAQPLSPEKQPQIQTKGLIEHIYLVIQQQRDESMNRCNYVLNGHLSLFSVLLLRNRQALVSEKLVDQILYEWLFYFKAITKSPNVKCLAKENVKVALDLLSGITIGIDYISIKRSKQTDQNSKKPLQSSSEVIAENLGFVEPNIGKQILQSLCSIHYLQDWRDSRDWSFDSSVTHEKPISGYVGLENPGCICYLNSLLQQLFMIESFRQCVLRIDYRQKVKTQPQNSMEVEVSEGKQREKAQQEFLIKDSPNLIPKLKQLFLLMMYSNKEAISPIFFTESIRTDDNHPVVRIYEQMDIDEFSMVLFDKIENQTQILSKRRRRNQGQLSEESDNFIRDLFGGYYSNEVISQECKHTSEREEQFLSISLQVKKSIKESFQSLVKGEMLEGENAYFCDGCNKKVKALKRLSIKRLPPHLIISLRRFEFDFEADAKIKINKYCEFPKKLNLLEYSQYKMNNRQHSGTRGSSPQQPFPRSKSRDQGVDNAETSQHQLHEDTVDQQEFELRDFEQQSYYQYRLKGVVVHSGSADSGHYYSFIEDRNGEWFEFNDEKVEPFDIEHLEEEAFGGKQGEYYKIKNAYLLFYERMSPNSKTMPVSPSDTEGKSQQCPQFKQDSRVLARSWKNLEENRVFTDYIASENIKLHLRQVVFGKDYSDFARNILQFSLNSFRVLEIANKQGDEESIKKIEDTLCIPSYVLQYEISFAFFIEMRKNHLLNMVDSMGNLQKSIFRMIESGKFRRQGFKMLGDLLWEMSTFSFISEFFLECNSRQKAKLIACFLSDCFEKYIEIFEKQSCDSEEQHSKRNESDDSGGAHKGVPDLVKRFIDLALKVIISKCCNISELCYILRKLVRKRTPSPKLYGSLMKYYLERNVLNILADNIFEVNCGSDDMKRKLSLFKTQEVKAAELSQPARTGSSGAKKKDPDSNKMEVEQQSLNVKAKPSPPQVAPPSVSHQPIREANFSPSSNLSAENQNSISDTDTESQAKGELSENISNSFTEHKQDSEERQKYLLPELYLYTPKYNVRKNEKEAWNILYLLYLPLKNLKQKGESHFSMFREQWCKESFVGKLEEEVTAFERKVFNQNAEATLIKLIQEMKDTKVIMSFCRFYCLVATNNWKASEQLLAVCEKALRDYEAIKYRPFFLLLENLLKIEDKLSVNEKYFSEYDLIQQWCIRYIITNPKFEATVLDKYHKEKSNFILQGINYARSKKQPNNETLRKNRLPTCERLLNKLHHIVVSSDVRDYEELARVKESFFLRLRDGRNHKIISYTPEPDPEETYPAGSQVCIYMDNSSWHEGVVEVNVLGLLKVKINKEHFYQWEDDEKVKLHPQNRSSAEKSNSRAQSKPSHSQVSKEQSAGSSSAHQSQPENQKSRQQKGTNSHKSPQQPSDAQRSSQPRQNSQFQSASQSQNPQSYIVKHTSIISTLTQKQRQLLERAEELTFEESEESETAKMEVELDNSFQRQNIDIDCTEDYI